MAITGRFEADFSNFLAAVDRAEIALVDLSSGSTKVEATLNRMTDNFSGRKLIQEASLMTIAIEKAGGTATLTAAELERVGTKANEAAEKLTRLGIEVPAGLQKIADETKGASSQFDAMKGIVGTLAGAFGIAFSAQAVVNFGREILASASSLVTLHDTTGISIEGLQRFQRAGDDAGNSIDQITTAITRMEDRLVGGDKSAVAAVAKLHLNLEALRALTPENQFIAISEAIRQIPDPAEQVNIAIDLFGRTGASVLPTLKRGFDDLKDSAGIMSDSTVRALDDVDDALTRASRVAKGEAAEAFAFLFLGWSEAQRDAANLTRQLNEMAATAAAALPKMEALKVPGLPEDLKAIERGFEEDAKALKAFGDAMTALNAVGVGWVGTLDTIDGATVEAIKFYLEAGVAQNTLATAYGLTAAQVKAVASELANETELLKIMQGIEKTTFDLAMQHNKQWREEATATAKRVNDAVIAELDAQQKLNAEYGRTVDGSLKASGAAETYRVALEKLQLTQVEGISQEKQKQVILDAYTKALYDEAVAQDAATAAMAKVPPAAAAAGASVQQFTNTLVLGITNLEDLNRELSKFYDQFAGNSVGTPGGGNVGTPIGNSAGMPRFAGSRDVGGPVSAGQSYFVGIGAQPELFTPATNGWMTPSGGGGGNTTVNNTIYVNGTAEDVARKVTAEIMRSLTAGQKLRPA